MNKPQRQLDEAINKKLDDLKRAGAGAGAKYLNLLREKQNGLANGISKKLENTANSLNNYVYTKNPSNSVQCNRNMNDVKSLPARRSMSERMAKSELSTDKNVADTNSRRIFLDKTPNTHSRLDEAVSESISLKHYNHNAQKRSSRQLLNEYASKAKKQVDNYINSTVFSAAILSFV